MARGDWQFVEIHWEDIVGSCEWCGLDDLPKLAYVVHRGWIVYEDDKVVVLSSSYIHPEDGGYVETVGDSCTIPINNIVSRRVLNV